MSPVLQRVIGVAALLITGVLTLPLSAALLDGEGTENWIVPAQLVAMAIVGVAVTLALPAMARAGAPTPRRVMTGLWWGLIATMIGDSIFWFLLSGIGGA